MKRLILMILFLSITSIGFSDDKPYYLYDMNGNLSKLNLIGTVDNIYVRLGLTVNTYGAQTVAGQKTFSSSIVGNLTGDVTGTASNASALNGESYEHFVTTSTDQSVGGKKTFDDIATSDTSLMRLIYSTSGVTISTVIISGLDGNTDKEYLVVMKSSSALGSTINFHFNADSTTANYEFGSMYNSGATTLAYYRGNNRLVGRSGTLTSIMTATLSVGTNGRIGLFHNSFTNTANQCDNMQFNSLSWKDKTTNITSMTFTFSESTVIHQFSLYSRR